ncbi:MAG: T9SS type A sorting domain-containing protein [Bacteroidota bacterium]
MQQSLPNRYARLVRRYVKLKARLEQQIQNGRFARFTRRKKHELVHRLERYRRQLVHLAGATAATTLGIFAPNISQAQTFCDSEKNPLEIFGTQSRTAIEFADLDGDGDLDAFSGAKTGGIDYYENVGDANNPAFLRLEYDQSPFPFDGQVKGFKAAFNAVDIDGDGDLDLFAGEKYSFGDINANGKVLFYENVGDANNAVFEERLGSTNPLDLVDVGDEALPFLADLDGDGDLDATVGSDDGTISYFENVGNASTASFEARVGLDNPFDGIDVGRIAAPDLVDIDDDGDLDLVVGEYDGTLKYYENVGDATAPDFKEQVYSRFSDIQTQNYALPNVVDIDDDGDFDLLISQYFNFYGTIAYYENKPACLPENVDGLVECGVANPLSDVFVLGSAAPDFADVDGDGDFDAVVGNATGEINIYENRGTATSPKFRKRVPLDNPFSNLFLDAKPDLVDFDNDGDFDLVVGQRGGPINYYENKSNDTEFIFEEKTGNDNPFNLLNTTTTLGSTTPELVDLDDDGDLDLIIGSSRRVSILYYENVGTPSNAIFQGTNTVNINIAAIKLLGRPKAIDYDGDGDLDLFVADLRKCINYYENVGTSSSPEFILRGGQNNPFNLDLGEDIAPAFVDIDNDGDIDAFVGQDDGTIKAYKNTTLSADAFVTDCDKENGDLVLEIESDEEAGPYVISDAFSATIGKRNQFGASASVPTAGLEDGIYVFEITPKGNLCDLTIVTSARVGENCETEDRTFEIEEVNTQAQLDVFPNPTAAVLNYDVNRLGLERIYIVDQLGRVVKNTRQINGQLDISDLANGTYILVLESEEELIREVIVKHD